LAFSDYTLSGYPDLFPTPIFAEIEECLILLANIGRIMISSDFSILRDDLESTVGKQ